MKILGGIIIPLICLLLIPDSGQTVWAATRAVQLRVAGCHT
ncbi:MAG TPA: hypothetical protein PK175_01280 [Syntrophales bacterium]|jgi:hypothetical protein|nr:hypothetical protein [Syntrophales bacterium]HON22625.1 hypothetical protein [Syntrophales bacterium]HOU77481.1 hypothetical protein [Syntrophales bacterium]HPC31819.1 hypothetical protein [Syntrophales bacterium]HQG33490.1 hypothetical protein [Syntrophales bacterium]